MAMSINTVKKLTKEELSYMALEYQGKFYNMLSNINTELTSLSETSRKWSLSF